MPENGDSLEIELLTTFVIGNFGHRHEFRDALQTARHRESRLRVGHVSRCGLIFQRCSYIEFCVRLVWFFKSRTLIFQDTIFRACQFLVLSLFVHVFPLLIGLACIDFQDLIFKSLLISNVVCAMIFQDTFLCWLVWRALICFIFVPSRCSFADWINVHCLTYIDFSSHVSFKHCLLMVWRVWFSWIDVHCLCFTSLLGFSWTCQIVFSFRLLGDVCSWIDVCTLIFV